MSVVTQDSTCESLPSPVTPATPSDMEHQLLGKLRADFDRLVDYLEDAGVLWNEIDAAVETMRATIDHLEATLAKRRVDLATSMTETIR